MRRWSQMIDKVFVINMESNKDEAKRCFDIARKLLASGDKEKAKKFLNKSKRLFPLEEAEKLLQELNTKKEHPTTNGNVPDGSSHTTTTHRRTKESNKEDSKKEPDYTPEQLSEVQRINKLKDYYAILGVEKDASDAELKKSYKKLALLCHPDKNRAPGSTDAFKAIGNSFAILNDPDKRKRYDQYGHDGPQQLHHHHNHYEDFEADITPEDLFNMFFGGAAGNRVFIHRQHRRRARRHHDDEDNEAHYHNGVGNMMHLIPILIFIGLSLVSSLLVQDPPYSFGISGDYRLHRVTPKYKVSYYVQNDFDDNYKGRTLTKLEHQIEREYVGRISSACYRERQLREEMFARGRFWGDQNLVERAQQMKMDSCDELNRIRAR